MDIIWYGGLTGEGIIIFSVIVLFLLVVAFFLYQSNKHL